MLNEQLEYENYLKVGYDGLLKERNLPPLRSREKMLQILQEEEYGFLPPAPEDVK